MGTCQPHAAQMTLTAVLLSSLLLNSVVLSGSMMMSAFAYTIRFASRTAVGACRAKRSLWLPM